MREIIDLQDLPLVKGRFSQAIRSDPFIFLAGMLASDFVTGLDPQVQPPRGFPYYGCPIQMQTRYVLQLLNKIAEGAGSSISEAVQVWCLLTDSSLTGQSFESQTAFFSEKGAPAVSAYGIQELAAPDAVIEIDAVLAAPGYDRKVFSWDERPSTWQGPRWSKVVQIGQFVFVSSHAPTDFNSALAPTARHNAELGYLHSSFRPQLEFVLKSLARTLTEVGSSLKDVVKVQVFLSDLADFPELDAIWREYFPKDPPARAIIPASLTIPDARVEINAIAIVPNGHIHRETVVTDKAPRPTIHEPQAIVAGDFVFLSQMMATDYVNGVAPAARGAAIPNYQNIVRSQLQYLFANSDSVLRAAGSSISHVVRRHAYYTHLNPYFPLGREVTREVFSPKPPPSTTVSIGRPLLVPDCVFMSDAIAVLA